jgi:hypothetical protein
VATAANTTIRARAFGTLAACDGVERNGDSKAPTAFRIWKAGINVTDHGAHEFTPQSADILMAHQAMRGNLYSIDADHMSLDPHAPPESRKAVGWHKLEVRQSAEGPELWAVDVQWTDAVKSGLEADVPEWRYFSPSYDVDRKSSQIVRYINTALTNNPATWGVTTLANTSGVKAMAKYEAILADLLGADEDKKSKAVAALAAAFPDEDGGGDGDKKDPKKEEKKEAVKTAAEDPPKKKEEEEKKEAVKTSEDPPKDKEEKKETATAITASTTSFDLAKRVQELEARDAERVAERAKEKTDTIRASLFAKRPDFTKEVREVLASVPLEQLEKAVKTWPRAVADIRASVNATFPLSNEPDPQHGGYVPRLDHEERRVLASLSTHVPAPSAVTIKASQKGTTFSMPTVNPTREQALARVAELDKELESL